MQGSALGMIMVSPKVPKPRGKLLSWLTTRWMWRVQKCHRPANPLTKWQKKNRGGTVHWFATSHLNYPTGYLNSESFLGAHAESPSVHEKKATGVSYVFWTIAYSCCYCKTTRAGGSQWRLAISHQLEGEHLSYYSAVFLTWLLYMIKLLINCIVNAMGRLFC